MGNQKASSFYSRGFIGLILGNTLTPTQKNLIQRSITSVPASGRLMYSIKSIYPILN